MPEYYMHPELAKLYALEIEEMGEYETTFEVNTEKETEELNENDSWNW